MGLDCYWRDEEANELPISFDPPLRLCGGMLSGNGESSFRGKVYAEEIETATGVSLYQPQIDADTVKKMALCLSTTPCPPTLEEGEWKDVQRMFTKYAEINAYLYGWW